MSNEIMDGNRILAEFEGYSIKEFPHAVIAIPNGAENDAGAWVRVNNLNYHTDRNALHCVWEKFRELKYSNEVHWQLSIYHRHRVSSAMTDGTLTDLYNALVNAVKWYNEVTKPATEAEYEKGRESN